MKHKSHKKAQISMQMIIMAILGLIVLIILIFVFKDQIGRVSKTYFGITEQTEAEAKGEICQSMFGGKRCMTSCQDPYKYDLGKDFSDCKKKGMTCCATEDGL